MIMAGAVSLRDERHHGWRRRRGRPKLVAAAIVCALIASSGVYYAFFACFFFLVAGVVAAVRRRHVRHVALPLALVALTFAVVTAHLAPSILHVYRQGDTPSVRRSPMNTETYGLRIMQLLLPTTGHRVDGLARFKDVVNAELRGNESDAASLGVIGAWDFWRSWSGACWEGSSGSGERTTAQTAWWTT